MKYLTTAILAAALFAAAFVAFAAEPEEATVVRPPQPGPRHLIEYGWYSVDTQYFKEHSAEMQSVPFSGLVLLVRNAILPEGKTGGTDTLGWKTFSPEPLSREMCDKAIADLKATDVGRFKENFVQLITMPGGIDPFDPEWDQVNKNAAELARVAKLGGCRGLMIDPENYGTPPVWRYEAQKYKDTKTIEEYRAQMLKRGKQFMRAINSQYPGITILFLFGRGVVPHGYDIYGTFYDGMIAAADSRTRLIDGYEFSYSYKTREQFEAGRGSIIETQRNLSLFPKDYDNHVRVGFGVWLDQRSHTPGYWFPEEPSKNYHPPSTWQQEVRAALETSDGYVWIYTERCDWWRGWQLDPGYYEAQEAALGAVNGEE